MNIPHRWILSCALTLVVGCASTAHQSQQPRITEVTRTTRLIGYTPAEHREEFCVVWTRCHASLVKFEYRQVNAPNELFAKSYVPTTRRFHVFTIAGDELRKGGKVSAWRASLWQNERLLAEMKSALW
ncbi:MAG: hypothetical protein FJ395_18525 [Verrucomicrobia bacterium]|nr:hypothetical protein [Verrucomicrobiota bacterium]